MEEQEHVEETTEEVVEQVEEAATEEAVEEVEETEEEVEAAPEEEEEPKKPALPKGVQKRIDKITRQRYEAERQVQELQQQLAQRPEPQPASTEKPTLEQFDYDDAKYMEALTDWKVEQALEARKQKEAETQQRSQQDQIYQEFESKRQHTLVQGIQAYEDFEDVVLDNPNLVITPQMAGIITDSEVGHEVAYHLGNNPDEAAKIAQLPPLKQAAAVAKIEARLSVKPAKKISKAPAPVNPVGAKGSSPSELDPSKDLKKWIQARNEGKI